jgi:hypothetical protein
MRIHRLLALLATAASLAGCEALVDTTAYPRPVLLESVALAPAALSLGVGAARQLALVGHYTDGSDRDLSADATWSTSDATKAVVRAGEPGLVRTLATGTATITASYPGQPAATVVVTVGAVAVEQLVLWSATGTSVRPGFGFQLALQAVYSDGSMQPIGRSATWTSSAPGTATVSGIGYVMGVGASATPATVTATVAGKSAAIDVTVRDPISMRVDLVPNVPLVPAGTSYQLSANALLDDATKADVTQSASWSSSNPAVATVTNTGTRGFLSVPANAPAGASATISASYQGLTDYLLVVVQGAGVTGPTVAVVPNTFSVEVGRTFTFSCFADYGGPIPVSFDCTGEAAWSGAPVGAVTFPSSTAPSQAKGTAVNASATVTATFRGASASATGAVVAGPVPTSVVVWPAVGLLLPSAIQPLHAWATFDDGTSQDVTASVTWTNPTANLTIGAGGSISTGASAIPAGGVTVTATYTNAAGSAAGSGSYGVASPGAITSVTVGALTNPVPVGGTTPLSATATGASYSGDVTQLATWNVTGPATFDPRTMLLTATGTGTITIQATFGGTLGTLNLPAKAIKRIDVSPPTASGVGNDVKNFTATLVWSDDTTLDVTSASSWSTNATWIVKTVPGTPGQVTLVGPGQGLVIAYYAVGTSAANAVAGTANVTVSAAKPTALSLSYAGTGLPPASTFKLRAYAVTTDNAFPRDVTEAATWSSSGGNLSVSNVAGAKGTVTTTTPSSTSSVTINVAYGGLTTPFAFTVYSGVTTVSPGYPSVTLAPGQVTPPVQVDFMWPDATTSDLAPIMTWTSSAPGTVVAHGAADWPSAKGLVSGVVPGGPVNVTASVGAWTAGFPVTVSTPLVSLATPNCCPTVGGFEIVCRPFVNDTVPNQFDVTSSAGFSTFTGALSGGTVAGGVKQAAGAGPGSFQVAWNAVTPVTVSCGGLAAGTDAVRVRINPGYLAAPIGSRGQFAAWVDTSDGGMFAAPTPNTLAWSASDASVASPVPGVPGNFYSDGMGATWITVQEPGAAGTFAQAGEALLEVEPRRVVGINVDCTNGQPVRAGWYSNCIANAVFANGTTYALPETRGATWTSSDPAVASVSDVPGSKGRLTTLFPGSACITATYQGFSGTDCIGVTADVPLKTFLGDPMFDVPFAVPAGSTAKAFLRLWVHYTDGFAADLASVAQWTTADPAVATIDSTTTPGQFFLKGISAGQTTVTGTFPGHPSVTATATVYVY